MDKIDSEYDFETSLQRGIERRQAELHDVAELVAKTAHRFSMLGNILRVTTITLGAIIAAKGVADNIFGGANQFNLVAFSLFGVCIAVAGGIEAAFKYEKRGAELTILAASCQSTVREIDSEWRKSIGSIYDSDLREEGRKLISLADERLSKVQETAAQLGVNIALKMYELQGAEYREQVSA